MPKYDLIPMKYDSKKQIDAIVMLEQQCKQFEQIHINAGIDHLVKEDGDHALLCYHHERLIGLLTWYTIRLGVVTENARALNLYHDVGFEVVSEYQYFVGHL